MASAIADVTPVKPCLAVVRTDQRIFRVIAWRRDVSVNPAAGTCLVARAPVEKMRCAVPLAIAKLVIGEARAHEI